MQGTSGTFHGDWTSCSVSCGNGTQSRRGIRFDSCGNSQNLDLEKQGPAINSPVQVTYFSRRHIFFTSAFS